MSEKPKCSICREKGTENEYYWNPNTNELTHASCVIHFYARYWENAKKPKEEQDQIFLEHLLYNNRVIREHVMKENTKELDGFYKKVIEKRGITKDVFDAKVKWMRDELSST